MDLSKLSACEWAVVGILLLLAAAGLYYVYLCCCGYHCVPLVTTKCPGGKPHHAVYVNDEELLALAKIAKHNGLPCHGIPSFPKDYFAALRKEAAGDKYLVGTDKARDIDEDLQHTALYDKIDRTIAKGKEALDRPYEEFHEYEDSLLTRNVVETDDDPDYTAI